MPIFLDCPSCGRKLAVPDSLLGSSVRCPHCRGEFTIPALADASPPAEGELPRDEREAEGVPRPDERPSPEEDEPGVPEEEGFRDRAADRFRLRTDVRPVVLGPTIALLVTGILGTLASVAVFFFSLLTMGARGSDAYALGKLMGCCASVVGVPLGILVTIGATLMMQRRGYGMAMTACIAAMLLVPGLCCLLGIPFGIWGLVVLARPDVKKAFR
jgi:hypothetical protein